MPELPQEKLKGAPCPACGEATLRFEERTELKLKPFGTWSLSGAQMKTSAIERTAVWLVCDACGVEAKGKPDGG